MLNGEICLLNDHFPDNSASCRAHDLNTFQRSAEFSQIIP